MSAEPGSGSAGQGQEPVPLKSEEPPAKRKRRIPGWLELPVTIGLALLVALVVKTFLLQVFYIPSGSMEDTLMVGDRVAVNRLAYRLGEPQRGDVVVFDGSGSFTEVPSEPEASNPIGAMVQEIGRTVGLVPPPDTVFVKRLIGVGGDHVQCCDTDGSILLNGRPLSEPYLHPGDPPSEDPFDVVVPPGHMWLMGDHRSASADSRAHLGDPGGGMVATDQAIGRVFAVIWPVSDWASVPSESYPQ